MPDLTLSFNNEEPGTATLRRLLLQQCHMLYLGVLHTGYEVFVHICHFVI